MLNNQAKIYLSNYLEELYDKLKENLFSSGSFFTKRLVIVPSSAIKNWIHFRLAEDPHINISAGISFQILHQSFKTLIPQHSNGDSFFFPDAFELSLCIESHLKKILRHEQDKVIWEPLISYLKKNNKQREKRILSLSLQLSTLFYKYGLYGKNLIQKWEEDSSLSDEWQKELWQRIFNGRANWLSATHAVELLLNSQNIKQDHQIHLFSLNSLPPLFFHFFENYNCRYPVCFYQLSPCKVFWSDLYSEKEFYKNQRGWDSLSSSSISKAEEYFEDRHRLLSNWGKLGRQFAYMLEDSSCVINEHYVLPHAIENHYSDYLDHEIKIQNEPRAWSRLLALQTDLLLYRNPEKDCHLPFSHSDCSIQIHCHYTRLREVQSLYQQLLKLFDEEAIEPKDVLIMAPDILTYESYIREVFGSKNSIIDFQISDSALLLKNSFLEGFFAFFELTEKKWNSDSIITLFKNPLFASKFLITQEHIKWIETWIKEANIKWGLNHAQRDDILKTNYSHTSLQATQLNKTTWEDGFERLLEATILQKDFSIDLSQIEFLGQFRSLLYSIYDDLCYIQDEHNLLDWRKYFQAIIQAYFIKSEETNLVEDFLKKLHSQPQWLKEQSFSFTSIFQKLKTELLSDTKNTHTHLQAVQFASLLPARSIPSKLICLIGMNEKDFPRHDAPYSLDLLIQKKFGDYCPSKSDLDRFSLLEAILSSRKMLLISYLAYSPVDASPLAPSILVQELIDYLDQCYSGNELFSKTQMIFHPLYCVDPIYFQNTHPYLINFSQSDFENSKSFFSEDVTDRIKLEIADVHEDPIQEHSHLELTMGDLINAFRYPLKIYFQKTLGIYLKDEKSLLETDDFVLSSWQKRALFIDSFTSDLESALKKNESAGKLPSGVFSQSAQFSMRHELSDIKQFFDHFLINPSDIHTEALSINLNEQAKKISLKGKIPNLSSQGLIIFGEYSELNLIKNYPYLIWLSKQDKIAKKLLFTKDRNEYLLKFNDNLAWNLIIKHYLELLKKPTFLMPEWIEPIFKKDKLSLSKKMEQSLNTEFSKSFDPYFEWFCRNYKLPSAEAIIDEYHPWAISFFENVFIVDN